MNYFLCELIIVQEFNRFKYCRIYNPRNDLVYNVLGIILYVCMYLNHALGNMLLRFIIVVSVAVCSSFFFFHCLRCACVSSVYAISTCSFLKARRE